MEIPEIQYQQQQLSSDVAPVAQGDVLPSLRENQQRTAGQMADQLAQMQRNGATQVANVQAQAFPVEQLTELSNTAAKLMEEKAESMKKELEAEMTMLAYQDGFSPTKEFEKSEKEFLKEGEGMNKRANKYQQETGDYEGAERIRGLSGWKKYYYAKAQVEMAGKGFGAWLKENASRQFPINGKMVSLNSGNAEERAAVVSYLSSEYMAPYQGMNKSFLGKYMFPSMQKGQSATLAAIAAERSALIKKNQIDEAKQLLYSTPDKGSAMDNYYQTRVAQGADNASIRAEMVEIASTFDTKAEVDSFLDSTFGPNGQTFRSQYPKETQQIMEGFYQLKQSAANNNARQRQLDDTNSLEEAMALVAKDKEDGTFDANPERLAELRDEAAAAGQTKTSKFWESQIAETAYMKNSKDLKAQYEAQMAAGVIPTEAEILQNAALSQEDKQSLLSKARDSGQAEPTTDQAKGHKDIILDSIKKRGKWSPTKANDPGVAAMEHQAWSQYKQDYNNELRKNGGDHNAAAIVALNNFKKEFSTGDAYRLISAKDIAEDPSIPKDRLNTYAGYDPNAITPVPASPLNEIRSKTQGPNAYMSIGEALEAPDLYKGEDVQLEALSKSFNTTGNIGTIPPVYYELQQQLGGKFSIMDLVNKRLQANGLDPLPEELNNIIKPVEDSFDEETYQYISYKPNATRTDIGMISSGQDPIYMQKIPTPVADDIEFQQGVTALAQRLGVSEGDLYAVMSFETGGTFNPAETNKMGSGATGLIQFMPSTAEGLGTTTEALAGMSRSQQLQYVERYLTNAGVKPGSNLSDLYMAVLFPAAVGKSDDFVLFGNGATVPGFGAGSRAYSQNRGLDSNGDGSITKAEASAKVLRHRKPAQPWRQPENMRTELQ